MQLLLLLLQCHTVRTVTTVYFGVRVVGESFAHIKKKNNNNNPMLENGRYNTIPSSVSVFVDD